MLEIRDRSRDSNDSSYFLKPFYPWEEYKAQVSGRIESLARRAGEAGATLGVI
jgi:hypothetical protein